MVIASEEVNPLITQEPQETSVAPPGPSPEELSLVGLSSGEGTKRVTAPTAVEKPLSQEYLESERNKPDAATIAKEQFWASVKEEEQFNPETTKALAGDFYLDLIERGMSPKDAQITMGKGEGASMEPSYLMDPVNIVTDLATGGIAGALKVGGKALVEMGAKASAGLIAKKALADAGFGLISSGSMDAADKVFHNSLTTFLSGFAGPMFLPQLTRRILQAGPRSAVSYIRNLGKNNPQLLDDMKVGIDEIVSHLGEDTSYLATRVGEIKEKQTQNAKEIPGALTNAMNQMKQAQDAALAQADAANKYVPPSQSPVTPEAKALSDAEVVPGFSSGNNAIKSANEDALTKAAAANQLWRETQILLQKAATVGEKEKKALEELATMKALRAALSEEPDGVSKTLSKDKDILAEAGTLKEAPPGPPQPSTSFVGEGAENLAAKGVPETVGEWVKKGKNVLDDARGIKESKKPPTTKVDIPVRMVSPNSGTERSVVELGRNDDTGELSSSVGVPEEHIAAFQKAVLSGDKALLHDFLDLNYDKIGSGEDAKNLIALAFEKAPELSHTPRSWDETREIAKRYGMPEILRGAKSYNDLDAKGWAQAQAMDYYVQKAIQMAGEMEAAKVAGNIPAALSVAFRETLGHAIEHIGNFKTLQTGAARLLSMGRAARKYGGEFDAFFLSRKAADLAMPEEAAEALSKIMTNLANSKDKNKEKRLVKLLEDTWGKRTRDMVTEVTINGMLSSPSTTTPLIGVNSLSSIGTTFMSFTERMLGVLNGGVSSHELKGWLKGAKEAFFPKTDTELQNLKWQGQDTQVTALTSLMKEHGLYTPRDIGNAIQSSLWGWIKGFNVIQSDAFKLSAAAFKKGVAHTDGVQRVENFTGTGFNRTGDWFRSRGWDKVGTGFDYLSKAINLPGKTMLFADEMAKSILIAAERNSLANRMAFEEGLTGVALEKRVQELLTSPPKELVDGATRYARDLTMQLNPESAVGKGTLQAFNEAPFPLKLITAPFIKTGINLLRFTSERTPGVNLVMKKYREELFSPDKAVRSLAMAKMELGAMFWLGSFAIVSSEHYTGAGPVDPEARRIWMAAGNKPHNIKVGNYQIDARRLEPLTTPMLLMSQLMSSIDHFTKDEAATMSSVVLGTLLNLVEDRQYLTGMHRLLSAMHDKTGAGLEKFVKGTMQSLVPYSSLSRNLNAATDGVVRDLWTAEEYLKAVLPLGSSSIPSRRTILGEPVYQPFGNNDEKGVKRFFQFEGAFNSMLSPTKMSPGKEGKNIYDELARLAEAGTLSHNPIRDKVYDPFSKEVIKLTHEQAAEFNDILSTHKFVGGKTFKQFLEDFVETPFYKDSLRNDILKGQEMSKVMTNFRGQAVEIFLRKHPELREAAVQKAKAEMLKKLSPQQ